MTRRPELSVEKTSPVRGDPAYRMRVTSVSPTRRRCGSTMRPPARLQGPTWASRPGVRSHFTAIAESRSMVSGSAPTMRHAASTCPVM